MMTLSPRGYGGFPLYQFSPPNQFNNRYYNGGHPRRLVSFGPHYPAKPLYQPPFNPVAHTIAPTVDQFRGPSSGTQLELFFNNLDMRYRQEQYERQLKKLEKQYWRLQGNNIPPPVYPLQTTMNYYPQTVYQYEKETKYVPFPVFVGTRAGLYGSGGGMDLPPKIRVIFVPTGQSFSQQPFLGSLTMPPFLYNRMSQPFCSFPLPPPLPQIGSLPLTPAVQQMVMQRYSNPVAVLSFVPNWPMSQMMMPNYSSIPQQPQQYIPPIPPIPALPSPPQSYIPPAAPQIHIPPPAPISLPSLQSASQACIQLPPTVISSLPSGPQVPIPQAHIPPPPPILLSVPAPPPLPAIPQGSPIVLVPPTSQPPSSSANATAFSYDNYTSICRACPPAPPPLNINVTGHCWIQHCAACHHVPTSVSNPNNRPNSGRVTPLLRQPIVPQYIPQQTEQRYYHANPPVITRPWLRKTPPLPPGAILISDKYADKKDSRSRYIRSQKQSRHDARDSHDKHRSMTISSRKANSTTSSGGLKNHRSVSPHKDNNKNNNNSFQQQGYIKTKSSIPLSTSSTSSGHLSSEYEKITFHPSTVQQNVAPQPLTREARNVNLQYKYQPVELSTVYLNNQYLKSSSEASTPASNTETPIKHSPPLTKGELCSNSLSSSPSVYSSNSVKNYLEKEEENGKTSRPPSHLKKAKEKLIVIRELVVNSPSTISTISSDMTFSIIDKDDDSFSTTSTVKVDPFEEDIVPLINVF